MQNNKPALLSWLLMLLLAVIWGSSYILIKLSLKTFNPVQLASARIFIAFLSLSPLLFVSRFREFKGRQWFFVILIGLSGSAIPALLFSIAQTKISSSLAAILNALVPLSTLLLGVFFFSENFTKNKISGIALGVAGSGVIILSKEGGFLNGSAFFALLVVLAGVCYALQTNLLKKYFNGVSPLGLAAWSFACIGPLAGALMYGTGVFSVIQENPDAMQGLMYVALLGMGGTALALVFFNKLIQNTSPLFASTVTYLIPFVAVAWGVNDNEIVGIVDFAGLGLILTGIYLTGK